jgi:arginine/lysine/ornithine decarboxylase
MILSGAVPIYVQPEINYDLGIAMGMPVDSVREAIKNNPNATSVFVINPTYYGAVSSLREICEIAHQNNMLVLADEAHGAHLPFNDELPVSAMEAGADMSAVSLHKTGGSMTQSSALFIRQSDKVTSNRVKSVLNLTQTTSASYILMASIDMARKQLAWRGRELVSKTLDLARYAREKINKIDGLYAFGKELVGTPGVYDFDETKLSIYVRKLGMSGYEMENVLRKEYNIQIELSDFYNIMAIMTFGDEKEDVDRLIAALKDIARKRGVKNIQNSNLVPCKTEMIIRPRDAYYSPKQTVKIEDAVGEISGEMIMAYPPGIPVICPGERITHEVVEYVQALKQEDTQLQGTEDPFINYIKVLNI